MVYTNQADIELFASLMIKGGLVAIKQGFYSDRPRESYAEVEKKAEDIINNANNPEELLGALNKGADKDTNSTETLDISNVGIDNTTDQVDDFNAGDTNNAKVIVEDPDGNFPDYDEDE